ncbi:hypothetical protein [Xenorhabdus sp. TH1]|uniref:hypothetical protein n=1 Tax=Xenorhabdus sp. TH1 TaxID=3130166 RepID=UPI0030D3924E
MKTTVISYLRLKQKRAKLKTGKPPRLLAYCTKFHQPPQNRNHPDATLQDKGFVVLSNDAGSNYQKQ